VVESTGAWTRTHGRNSSAAPEQFWTDVLPSTSTEFNPKQACDCRHQLCPSAATWQIKQNMVFDYAPPAPLCENSDKNQKSGPDKL